MCPAIGRAQIGLDSGLGATSVRACAAGDYLRRSAQAMASARELTPSLS